MFLRNISILFISLIFVGVQSTTTISSCGELQNITNNLNGNYSISKSFSCSGFKFSTIATNNNFTGCLNGNGFTISDLQMNSSTYVGLFGNGLACTVQNLVLSNISLHSYGNLPTASLFGICTECTIKDCVLTNPVSSGNNIQNSFTNSPGSYVAGYCGKMSGGTMINCTIYNTVVQGICSGGFNFYANHSQINTFKTFFQESILTLRGSWDMQ